MMNIYTNAIYDKTDKLVGHLDGAKLHLDGIEYYLVESKKRITGWRCFGIYKTNWRFQCKIYSNEIRLSLKTDCKSHSDGPGTCTYVQADLVLMNTVVRLGNEFTYGSLFA